MENTVLISGEVRAGDFRLVFDGTRHGTRIFIDNHELKMVNRCELVMSGDDYPTLRLEADVFLTGELLARIPRTTDDEPPAG